ncbi:MAG: DUF2892 domain-containing protein [Deltaproteobacteria bacterium]|nr:DUF2892 domain-containing protein [Deltaproteobacteria bacterium]
MNTCKSTQVDIWLRGIAGTMVILASLLTYFHSQNWVYFLLFIGLNLLQSAFTKWCPMMTILRRVFQMQG